MVVTRSRWRSSSTAWGSNARWMTNLPPLIQVAIVVTFSAPMSNMGAQTSETSS
jgi:hypothetical protein